MEKDQWFVNHVKLVGKLIQSVDNKSLKDITKIFLTQCCFELKVLTNQQIAMTFWLLEGCSVRKTRTKFTELFNIAISLSCVSKCFIRTICGELWEQGEKIPASGSISYCDGIKLAAIIDLKIARNLNPSIKEACDTALELWNKRSSIALQFFKAVPHQGKLENLPQYAKRLLNSTPPNFEYNFIENFAKRSGFLLRSGEYIERQRSINCTAATLLRWCCQFQPLFKLYEKRGELLFNFDETMISFSKDEKKFFTRRGQKRALIVTQQQIPHITAGCCFSQNGLAVPLFIILNNIVNLPESLHKYMMNNEVWIASQTSGWMTQSLFYEWCRCFTHWLSWQRKFFRYENLRNPVTLVLDSHNSRMSPAALLLLKACNVRVITFPPHSTHILQPFDVVIAKSLKTEFTKIYKSKQRLIKEKTLTADIKRELAVAALIEAYKRVITYDSCRRAFEQSGLAPFSPVAMLSGRGINPNSNLDPEKEARRTKKTLVITSTEITDEKMIDLLSKYENEKKITKKSKKEKKREEELNIGYMHSFIPSITDIIKQTQKSIQEAERRPPSEIRLIAGPGKIDEFKNKYSANLQNAEAFWNQIY